MSEVELILLNEGNRCTLYSIQFTSEDNSEYERFYAKFIEDAKPEPRPSSNSADCRQDC